MKQIFSWLTLSMVGAGILAGCSGGGGGSNGGGPGGGGPGGGGGNLPQRIVYSSNVDGDFEIYSVLPNGTDRKQLTNNPATDEFPSLSPDGRFIVFSSNRDGNFEIYQMRVDGSDLLRLTEDSPNALVKPRDTQPVWSPDNNSIAWVSSRGIGPASPAVNNIWIMDATGANQRRVTSNAQASFDPAFSPDSNTIAYVSPKGNQDGRGELYLINVNGTSDRKVTLPDTDIEGPSFSPDGTRVIYSRVVSNTNFQLRTATITTSGVASNVTTVNVPTTFNRNPSFAPDGNRIVYEGNNGTDDPQIVIFNLSNSTASPLTTQETNVHPSWGGR